MFYVLSAAGHSETPIIPVMLGDEDLAREFSARLFEEGVFASAIWYFYSRPLLSIFRFAKPGSGAVQSCVVFAKTRSCQRLLGAFLFSLCLFRFSHKTVCFVGQLSDGAAGDGACACDCVC